MVYVLLVIYEDHYRHRSEKLAGFIAKTNWLVVLRGVD